jgi:hypothetical protein
MGIAAVSMALLPSFCATAEAATFYVSAQTGNDRNDGLSPQQSWRTLAKVNALKLAPSDQIVLAEGEEFTGHLELRADEAGTPDHPIVIRGAGARHATILSPDQTAISIAAGGIEIRNLTLDGRATAKKKGHNGITFIAAGKKRERYPYIRMDNLEIRNFGDAGILIGSNDNHLSGYDDVQITHTNIRGNYGTGIISYDQIGDRTKGYAHRDVIVRDCDVSGNHDGSGIILSGIDRGLVEYCRASDNDGPGGGVGIWAYAAKNVRFRYCIASGTRTHGKDGGGFDLDGACIDCVIENCLSYENDGPGYMHCDYPTAGITKGNQIRSSISINDGQYKEKPGAVGFGFVTWGSGLDDCHITGNLALVTKDSPKGMAGGTLFVSYVPNYQADADVLHVRNCTMDYNVVVVCGIGPALVWSDLPKATPADVRFEGNTYLTRNGIAPLFVWDDRSYTAWDAWHNATTQEADTGHIKASDLPDVTTIAYALKEPRNLPDFSLMTWLIKAVTQKTNQ